MHITHQGRGTKPRQVHCLVSSVNCLSVVTKTVMT